MIILFAVTLLWVTPAILSGAFSPSDEEACVQKVNSPNSPRNEEGCSNSDDEADEEATEELDPANP